MKHPLLFILLAVSPALSAQEYARVLSDETVYTFRSLESAEIEETFRILINSEKGKQYSRFYQATDQFRKISDVTMDILDTQGERVKRFRKSDGHEVGFNPSYEISDAKIFFIDPKYQNYPFIIELHFVVKLSGYLSLPPWVPRDHFNLAVDQSRLTVKWSQDLSPSFKEEHIEGTSGTEKGFETKTYEVKNLPAVDRKLRYTDFYDAQTKVLISPGKFKLGNNEGSLESWSSFGDWFLSLNSDPYVLDPKTKAFIDQLDKNDQRELIRRVYQYMQDKVRYVSIQLGIGGFKSLPTEMVEKCGYGDCKALSTYMRNMLDYAGIPTNYILARAGEDAPDVEADFPSNQFNHVYLAVPMPRDTVYLECTSQTSPSDYTGTFTDDRNVLWIEKQKSRIVRSRIYPHTSNIRKATIAIQLNVNGDASIHYQMTKEGIFFDELRIYQQAPADYISEHNQRKFNYSDFAIKSFDYTQPSRDQAEFNSNFTIEAKGLAKLAGNRLVLPIMPTTPIKNFVDGDDLEKYYAIKRGMTIEDNIEVELPQNYWIYSLPEEGKVESRFGSYNLKTEFDGQKLKIHRKIILYKGDYVQKDFEEFRSFFQQMDKLESRKLVMNSKT